MPCSVVGVPRMVSMHDWKPTASTGRPQNVIPPMDGSTILAEVGKLFIVKATVRSNRRFP
jgi:hypothetical protein